MQIAGPIKSDGFVLTDDCRLRRALKPDTKAARRGDQGRCTILYHWYLALFSSRRKLEQSTVLINNSRSYSCHGDVFVVSQIMFTFTSAIFRPTVEANLGSDKWLRINIFFFLVSSAFTQELWTTRSTFLPQNLRFSGVDCPTADICYTVGDDSLERPIIYKTWDGGEFWSAIHFEGQEAPRCVKFLNQDTGFVAGWRGLIAKTENGGNTWKLLDTHTLAGFRSIICPNSQIIFAVGTSDSIMTSFDGGNSWSLIPTQSGDELLTIAFAGPEIGYAAGDGALVKTTNGGRSWFRPDTVKNRYIRSISFPSRDTGFAVGGFGKIMKTTDGALHWTNLESRDVQVFLSVAFANTSTGYVTGGGGHILKTTDGGISWNGQQAESSQILRAVAINGTDKGISVGFFSTILELVGIHKLVGTLPKGQRQYGNNRLQILFYGYNILGKSKFLRPL